MSPGNDGECGPVSVLLRDGRALVLYSTESCEQFQKRVFCPSNLCPFFLFLDIILLGTHPYPWKRGWLLTIA